MGRAGAYYVEKKDYFFSGPLTFMFWPSPRPGSVTNRSDGFRRHIKTSRSVQIDAVVALQRHFGCRNCPKVLTHGIIHVVLSNKENTQLHQSKRLSDFKVVLRRDYCPVLDTVLLDVFTCLRKPSDRLVALPGRRDDQNIKVSGLLKK